MYKFPWKIKYFFKFQIKFLYLLWNKWDTIISLLAKIGHQTLTLKNSDHLKTSKRKMSEFVAGVTMWTHHPLLAPDTLPRWPSSGWPAHRQKPNWQVPFSEDSPCAGFCLLSHSAAPLGSFHKSLDLLRRGVLFSSLLSPQDVMAPLFPQPLIQSSNELGASLWPWMMSPPTMRFRTWIGRTERSPRRHVRYCLLRRCFFSKHLTAGSNKKSGKHVKQQLRAGPLCCLHPLSGRFKKFTGAGIPVSQAERKSLQVKNNPATKEVKAVDGERLHLNSVRSRNGSRVHLNWKKKNLLSGWCEEIDIFLIFIILIYISLEDT